MDDASFLEAFEAAAIPASEWTHRAHVRTAYLLLRERPFEEALRMLREGIQALNRANGVRETPTTGYHETVTVAWARILAATLAAHGAATDFDSFADENRHLFSSSLLRLYYTRSRIQSPEAKAHFVEPDVAPLPPPRDSGQPSEARD